MDESSSPEPNEIKIAQRMEEIAARIIQNALDQGRAVTEMAKHLNISEEAVRQIQAGNRPLSIEEIQSLAGLIDVAFPLLILKNIDHAALSPQLRQILLATLQILDGNMRHVGTDQEET